MRRIFLFCLLLAIGAEAEPPPDMVLVPAAEFLMGSDEGHTDEQPPRRVRVSAYYMDRDEVTNEAFAEFVREAATFDKIEGSWFRYYAPGCRDLLAHYKNRYGVTLDTLDSDGRADSKDVARWRSAVAALAIAPDAGTSAKLPVRGVTWRDAVAFARWAGKRLPTEAEWELAATGAERTRYPWGNEWDPARCQAGLAANAGPAAVGSYPDGASSYGCRDMAGNVWEWVADWYGEDYYASSEDTVNPTGPKGLPDGQLPKPTDDINLLRSARQGRESDTRKVIRGGGWSGPVNRQAQFNTRCARRLWSNPSYWHPDVGFRCARDAE